MKKKPTASTIPMGKNLEANSLRSVTRQRYRLSLFFFNILLNILTGAIGQKKEINGIQIGKEVKPSPFADDMILYIRDPKNSIRRL